MKWLVFFILSFTFYSCQKGPVILKSHFDTRNIPPEVDYSKPESWAALPDKIDMADSLPQKTSIQDGQKNAKVDVFFIHPTIYTYKPTNHYQWNADVNDSFLNNKTDLSTILNQATAFNGLCKVYAPRYRQAHYYSFVTENKADSHLALNLAYSDVKRAFEHYLEYSNGNRPIIIASHSQGTVHAKRLLKEYFDGKELQKKLVMAYIIGISVTPDSFDNLIPSQNPTQIGCYAAWNTFSKGYYPKWYEKSLINSVCTNPLTWSSTDGYAPYSMNLGGVGPKFKFYPELTDAQNNKGLLWVNRPKIPGSFLVRKKIWHIADINFFWMNIRENVETRINSYFSLNK
ncbi:MAG: DUF3089 domain-containing protein [Bacteroidota bacterium]